MKPLKLQNTQPQQWQLYMRRQHIKFQKFNLPSQAQLESLRKFVCIDDNEVQKALRKIQYNLDKISQQAKRDECKYLTVEVRRFANRFKVYCRCKFKFNLSCKFNMTYCLNFQTAELVLEGYSTQHIHYSPDITTNTAKKYYRMMIEERTRNPTKFRQIIRNPDVSVWKNEDLEHGNVYKYGQVDNGIEGIWKTDVAQYRQKGKNKKIKKGDSCKSKYRYQQQEEEEEEEEQQQLKQQLNQYKSTRGYVYDTLDQNQQQFQQENDK